MESRIEPVVRIRAASPADALRCRNALEAAGLLAQESLTWLVVRDADPDAVNAELVARGALGRVVAREGIGKLVGWLIDRQGEVEGRARNVRSLVERTVSDAGLQARYAARDDAALLAAARALYETLMAEGGAFLPWARFVALFCVERSVSPSPAAAG